MIALTTVGAGLAHGWMTDLSQAATGSLLAAVWQGILLAGAAGLGLRLLPKTPPAVRFAIWFGVFLVVAGLPVLSLWPHAAAPAGGRGPWMTLDVRWSVAIAAVWALASLWRAGQLVVAAFRVRQLWKRATPVQVEGAGFVHPTHDDGTVMDGAPGLSRWDGRRAAICTSDEVDRPTVIGFFSPKILIPAWLLDKLSAVELEQIVLHESSHLGRADDWMNLLQKLALVVFPLNPALAWVERRLCFERELAVDERVLQATGAPKAYAACLATLAEHRLQRRGLALVLGALGRESELGRRVSRILLRGDRMKPLHAKLVLGGAMLGLLVSATALERCPQVVGFASPSKVEAANGEQAAVVRKAMAGYAAQPVMFRMTVAPAQEWKTVGDASHSAAKHQGKSGIQGNREVTHSVRGEGPRAFEASNKAQPLPANHILANSDAGLAETAAADPGGTEQGGDVVMTQRTVVTLWRDGSRTVLTTARVSSAAPQKQQDTDAPQAQATEPQQQAPRYAAVQVRGGWLVFQL